MAYNTAATWQLHINCHESPHGLLLKSFWVNKQAHENHEHVHENHRSAPKNSMKTINFTIKKPPYSTTISICNFSPIFPISGRQLTSRLRKSGAQDKTGLAFMLMTCTLLVLLFMAAMRRAVVENCAANCVMWDGKNGKIRREMMEIYGTYMEICGKYMGNTWEMMEIYIYMG